MYLILNNYFSLQKISYQFWYLKSYGLLSTFVYFFFPNETSYLEEGRMAEGVDALLKSLKS